MVSTQRDKSTVGTGMISLASVSFGVKHGHPHHAPILPHTHSGAQAGQVDRVQTD